MQCLILTMKINFSNNIKVILNENYMYLFLPPFFIGYDGGNIFHA